MTTWSPPIPLALLPTSESESFRTMPEGWTGLPVGPHHPGAFGVQRKNHVHEGVDLYCEVGTPVSAVEPGTVVAIEPFTGPKAGSPWWLDTMSVMVDGESGCVLYGEIEPLPGLRVGQKVDRGQRLGEVIRVLSKDKGRPMTMLHLELHVPGTKEALEWVDVRPATLLDPTPLLMDAARRSWNPPDRPSFVKAGDELVPISNVDGMDIADVENARVSIRLKDGRTLLAEGFDALESVWLVRASALEGRRKGPPKSDRVPALGWCLVEGLDPATEVHLSGGAGAVLGEAPVEPYIK